MSARVSIVIPSWNRRALVVECLGSLSSQTFRDFAAIVVDDGSTDDTVEILSRDFPEMRVVRLPDNRGFAAAANAGMRAADAPLVFLLNNDMTLAPDCLERLVQRAEQSDAAMFAPLMLFRDRPDVIYSAGDGQLACGRPVSIGHGCDASGFRHPDRIFGVSAGAALYRRELLDRIGSFDERFGAYFEDSDLNFRARLAGFAAEVVRDAAAYHVGSASLEGRHVWRARQCCRNHALLVVKNMPAGLLVRHAREIIAERFHQNRRVWSVARAENGAWHALAALLGTWFSTARQIPHALAERRRIQRMRTLDTAELAALLWTRDEQG